MDFSISQWYLKKVPSNPGWYFISTDTPISVLKDLCSPPKTYKNRHGEKKKVRNYNLSKRAEKNESFVKEDGLVINVSEGIRVVYSGKTKSLSYRAREHTSGHRGTAALALANYTEIKKYCWNYHFLESSKYQFRASNDEILLKLGEQVWRSIYGWPILSSG